MTSPVATPASTPQASGLRLGDLGTIVGALLAVVFSFLPQLKSGAGHVATWHGEFLSTQFSVPIAAAVAGLLALGCAFVPGFAGVKVGATMRGWSTVLAVVAAVGSVFAILQFHEYNVNLLEKSAKLGYGAYVMLVGAVICGVAAILTETLPALGKPLVSNEPKPAQQGWGTPGQYGQPGAGQYGQQPGQYGQPQQSSQSGPYGQQPAFGAPQTASQYGQPQPAQPSGQYGQQPAFGAPAQSSPEPAGQYGQPQPANPWGQPSQPSTSQYGQPSFGAPAEPEPAAPSWGSSATPSPSEPTISAQLPEDPTKTNIVSRPTPAPAAATPASTSPFWACFPTSRPLVDLTDRSTTLTQLSPSDWYLVTGHDESGAVIRLDDGRSGYLADASGLTRG